MTGMEDVLAAHQYDLEKGVCTCSDEVQVGLKCDAQTHPQHVAQALTAAGYGNLHDAWAEGAVTALCKTLVRNPYPAPKVSET